jgi:hypothetical protein
MTPGSASHRDRRQAVGMQTEVRYRDLGQRNARERSGGACYRPTIRPLSHREPQTALESSATET